MSLRRNILWNVLGLGFSVALPLLAVPWYLAALGAQNWGLVSIMTTLVSLLGMLEAGVGVALIREFSLRSPSTDSDASAQASAKERARALLSGFEPRYWGGCAAIAVLTALAARPIAILWFHLDGSAAQGGAIAVYAAAAMFLVQFPGFLYRGALMGANAYGRINTTQAALGVVRHGGGVILVQFVPEIAALMAWQVLCALAETLIRRKLCGQVLGTAKPSVALVHSEFGASWPAVTRMWGAILLQVVSYQIDKAMVGRLAPIDAFGFYAIASTLAMGVLQLSAPITQAALPQLATLQQRPQEMRRLNRRVGAMMLALVVSGGAVFLLFGEPILRLWLGSGEKAQIVHGPLAALLVGSALNTAYSLGNMNWIAAGSARAVASVNILGLVLTVSLSPMAVAHYGIAGGAVGWVAMNAIGLFASLWWMARTGRL